jgi:hypothetical protein
MAKRERVQKNDDPRLQSVWRAAIGKPDGIRLACKDEGEAKRLRFALYNSVRHLREPGGTVMADSELIEAVNNCSISMIEPGVLLVQDKQFSPMMSVVTKALEAYAIPVKTETADAAAASLKRLMEMGVEVETVNDQAVPVAAPTDGELSEEARVKAAALARARSYLGK